MLKELVIENVAVIEKADVTFDTGLNILTGETGAGKSIIIDSINAIMGNRTSREIVRTGTDRASIFAEFDALGADAVTMISEMGYGSDDTLILNREITADGKSRCRINGMPATAQAMREICSTLINIHGQHDSQDLLNPERHIHILDDFSGIGDQLAAYGSVYSELQAVRKAISGINTDVAYKERQKDLLSYQISEIAGAELRPGEEEQLNEQRKIIRNAEKLREALSAAIDAISGNENEGASDLIYRAAASVESVAGISEALAKNAERLNDTYYQLNDISEDLRSALEEFEGSGDDIDAVEGRLDLIYRLKMKYGSSVEEVLAFLAKAQEELEGIESGDERLKALTEREEKLRERADELAAELTALRKAAFGRFEGEIREELRFLNMPEVRFTCEHKLGDLGPGGRDSMEFFISTNPGEPPKPLSRIASGGELSRIMLAVKNVLAEKDRIGTLIFDEIDTGVSGSGAQKIGLKLKQASGSRQIICVTHSAPIAAFADCHLFIEKDVRDGRTYTSVRRLAFEDRKREIARIISGDAVTEIALKNAEEMIQSSAGIQ